MANLFLESFDLDSGTVLSKWESNAVTGFVAGRTGNAASLSNNYPTKSFPTRSTVILGFAVKLTNGSTTINFTDAGTAQASVTMDSSTGVIRANNGNVGTLLGSSAGGVAPANTWIYVEIKMTFHTTAGVVVVKVNGTEVLNLTSKNTSGANTTNQANTFTLYVSPPNTALFDDLYLCDTLGSIHDNFLGDLRVAALLPTSDTHQGLTPSTGTDHYALVDEVGPNTTDYNSSATPGVYDLLGHANLPGDATQVLGLQVNTYVQKDNAGARTLSHLVKTDAGTYETPSPFGLSGPGGWGSKISVFDKDPNDSSALSVTKINAIETGYKVVA